MSTANNNLLATVGKFLEALQRYQSASVRVNDAALRLATNNHALCVEAGKVVRAAAPMITAPRRSPQMTRE
jgi:hypothetical protein